MGKLTKSLALSGALFFASHNLDALTYEGIYFPDAIKGVFSHFSLFPFNVGINAKFKTPEGREDSEDYDVSVFAENGFRQLKPIGKKVKGIPDNLYFKFKHLTPFNWDFDFRLKWYLPDGRVAIVDYNVDPQKKNGYFDAVLANEKDNPSVSDYLGYGK